MSSFLLVGFIVFFFVVLGIISIQKLIFICAPNEVLIFSGKRVYKDGRVFGYRLVKGGRGVCLPLVEKVDRLDLTNMVIDVTAHNAYSKGGIPLTVQGVANVKIAGHEPILNHAVERFLGKPREEIIEIAKATLEGSLRGILATLTPEQVNEDKILFAERLVHEAEQDMTNLGFVVDSLKIQNVQDEVKYLDSIGRKKNAEVISKARIAEAKARADSRIRAAENKQKEVEAQVAAKRQLSAAEAERRVAETLSKREALKAEERAKVLALAAQAKAELDVQKARIEQLRQQYEADIIQPAKASCEAMENAAKAKAMTLVETSKAKVDALNALVSKTAELGPESIEILLVQRLEPIMKQLAEIVTPAEDEQLTIVGATPFPFLGRMDQAPMDAKVASWYVLVKEVLDGLKESFGIEASDKLKNQLVQVVGSVKCRLE